MALSYSLQCSGHGPCTRAHVYTALRAVYTACIYTAVPCIRPYTRIHVYTADRRLCKGRVGQCTRPFSAVYTAGRVTAAVYVLFRPVYATGCVHGEVHCVHGRYMAVYTRPCTSRVHGSCTRPCGGCVHDGLQAVQTAVYACTRAVYTSPYRAV